jgi:DedD protein
VERRVKERLVGAAVLVAAAIILIPEMLSGPKEKQPARASSQQSSPLKTYTIDLTRSPGASSSAQLEERAPPPEVLAETAPPDSSPQASPDSTTSTENSAEEAQASPESESGSEPAPQVEERTASAVPPVKANPPSEQPPRTPERSAPARETSPAPIASSSPVPTSRGWAVQAGSFASKATADGLARDLSKSGQNAFVMPVKSGTSTLYRVRVGPFADRAAANDALRGVKERVANAAVVAHP